MFKYSIVLLLFFSVESSAGWGELFDEGYKILQEAVEAELLEREALKKESLEKETSSNDEANSKDEKPADDVKEPLAEIPAHWSVHIDKEPVFNSQLYSIEVGESNTQTVVLIHGLGHSGLRDWLNVVPALEKNYHVLAVDLPGFGLSEQPDGRYSPSNYAKVVNWLVKKYAHSGVVVVGHSMGGAVALRYASEYPDQVEKLILVDVAGILEQTAFVKHSAALPIHDEYIPNGLKRIVAQIKDFTSYWVEKVSTIPDVTEVINGSDIIWAKVFSGQTNVNAALALVKENFYEAIKKLPHETIIIWGRLDTIAPLRTGEMLAGRLANASLVIIEGSKHVPMISHPKEFNRLLNKALVPATPVIVKEIVLESQGDFNCDEQDGATVTGRYDTMMINNCAAITLRDVVAQKIIVKDSLIEFYNTQVISSDTALVVYDSVVVATNSSFTGSLGVYAEASRIDVAGVSIKGREKAITIGAKSPEDKSRFIFSVSDLSSNRYTGQVHGVYNEADTTLGIVLAED